MIDPEPGTILKAWEERMKKRKQHEAEEEAKQAELLRKEYENRRIIGRSFKIAPPEKT